MYNIIYEKTLHIIHRLSIDNVFFWDRKTSVHGKTPLRSKPDGSGPCLPVSTVDVWRISTFIRWLVKAKEQTAFDDCQPGSTVLNPAQSSLRRTLN